MTKPTDPNLPPTKDRRSTKQLERLLEGRRAHEEGKHEMAIAYRPLIMCGLPLRPVKGTHYTRRCGEYEVEIIGSSKYGIPYGQDRLLPIFFATYYVSLGCPEDATLVFPHARDILRVFDLPVGGSYYAWLQSALRRVSGAIFRIEKVGNPQEGRRGTETHNIPLMSYSHLWYEETERPRQLELPRLPELPPEIPSLIARREPRAPEKPNIVRLDERWAKEIREHPVPVSLQVVKALHHHPGALDFYQWQIWRSYTIKKELRIPLRRKEKGPPGQPEKEKGLIAQLGCLEGQPTIEVRRRIREWQRLIKFEWPDCPNYLSRDGQAFVLRPAVALGQLEANRFLLKLLRETPR